MGWPLVLVGVGFGIIIIKEVMDKQDNTKTSFYKPGALVCHIKKQRFNLKTDYNEPERFVKMDDNTGLPYVLLDAKVPDPRYFLDPNNYKIHEWSGVTWIENGLNKVKEFRMEGMEQLQEQNQVLQDSLSYAENRVFELETKIESEFGKKISVMEKMNEASRKGMILPQKKTTR